MDTQLLQTRVELTNDLTALYPCNIIPLFKKTGSHEIIEIELY